MLMNRLGTHSSIALKPTSALQTACRHAMHSIQFMLRRMLPSVLNSYMPAPQHHVLNQWQIYKQGSSFSFVYGPCTSKSVDWLHLMTHRYSYNISCSISHTVVLSRLTVVLQGISSHSYNKNIKADSVSAIFVQGFQVEQTILSLLLLVNGLAVDRLDCTVLQDSSCLRSSVTSFTSGENDGKPVDATLTLVAYTTGLHSVIRVWSCVFS